MSERAGKAVAVARGAGRGVAEAPGADDDRVCPDAVPAVRNDPETLPGGIADDLPDRGAERHPHTGFLYLPFHRPGHIRRVVGCGKRPVPPLDFCPAAGRFQKADHIFRAERPSGRVHEARIADDVSDKVRKITGIGKVAPSLACDVDLFTKLFVFLEKPDAVACLRRRKGGHHAGSAASDHDHV